jgi:hypothetical protein
MMTSWFRRSYSEENEEMEDYKDRIGEPVRGWDDDGSEAWGLFFGTRSIDNKYAVVYHRTKGGKSTEYFEHIEFLTPSVFRHYGKRAMVDDMPEVSIIFTTPDGFCYVTSDLKKFELGSKDYRGVERPNYKLLPDTHTITLDGKENELMEEQKKPKFDYEQTNAIYCWFGDPCYDLASIADTEEQKDYLGMIEKISGITGATNLQQAEFFNELFSVLTPEQKARIMEVLG